MLTETPAGLYCASGDFHIDPWGAVPRAVITHAHGDHARPGSDAYLCAASCAPLLARRFGPERVDSSRCRTASASRLAAVRVSFHPAGHILGSAQVRIEGRDGVWVVSRRLQARAGSDVRAFEPVPCDTFITEIDIRPADLPLGSDRPS